MNKELIKKAKYADISSLNLKLKKEGSSYYRSEEHSSLLFKLGRNGFWIFDWNSRNERGDLIKFVSIYYNLDFVHAVEFLVGETVETKQEHLKKITIPKSETKLKMPLKNADMRRVIAYLNKTRCIKQKTIQYLIDKKLLYQDVNGNCVFTWVSLEGKKIGAELNGTLTSKRFKGIAQGSEWAEGFNIHSGQIKTIYVFESAIDLLSFTNLNKCQNCMLISMSGLKKEVIHNYANKFPNADIVMCIDNDAAADNFIKRNNFNKYKRIIPKYKDFNEDLVKKGV